MAKNFTPPRRGKLKIGVLFGGKSAEHEVSLVSAKNIINALDKNKYEVVPIGINKDGRWLLGDSKNYLLNSDNVKLIKINQSRKEVALYAEGHGALTPIGLSKVKAKIDLIFPVLHGTFGEDGSMQGLLKLAGIPYVGAGVLGSAVGMDKDIMKRLLREAGIPTPKSLAFSFSQKVSFREIKNKLGLPVFVKPANLGSSVGISKVKSESEWNSALKNAFQFDSKVIVEEFIPGREIECSVLGNEKPIASIPGEIIVNS